MKLTFDQIRKKFDADYCYNQRTRERAAADLVFYHITHWDDSMLEASPLQYRGEFDLLRKGKRDIIADMRANPIQADFEPIDGTSEDEADLMDGLYRASCRKNASKEAFDYACDEQVVSGLGGWRLVTKYVSDALGTRNQIVERLPIREFNSRVFFDCSAELIDKSDAKHVTVLTPFTPEGYIELVKDVTGETISEDEIAGNFSYPENGISFPWFGANSQKDVVYVGEFYCRYKTKVRIQFFRDMFGSLQAFEQPYGKAKGWVDPIITEAGFELESEKTIEKWVVDKYLVSGDGIIGEPERIAGTELPIIPQYGERAFVQGVEHYEGIVKAARDPQLLRDFSMSYLADIVGRSPRIKPIYFPEQVQGFEHMHAQTGADSDYPYLLQNQFDDQGNALPLGPVAQTLEQPVPTALSQLMAEMRMAVEDVVNPGLPNNIADPDLSGKALNTLTALFDQQSIGYQENRKYAMRRDAEIFAAIMSDIMDTPRKMVTETPDGNRREVIMMEEKLNVETGEMETLNDITQAKFEVYADIGKAFSSSRDEARDMLTELLPAVSQTDPELAQITQLKIISLTDGPHMKDFREWASKKLVMMGIRKPETEEEAAELQAMQQAQAQQQDPNMALAMAEQMKAENGAIKNQIDQFRAETDRMAVMVDAEKAGAEIDYKSVQTQSIKFNDAMKLRQPARPTNAMQ
jgi:hypothetical protein